MHNKGQLNPEKYKLFLQREVKNVKSYKFYDIDFR